MPAKAALSPPLGGSWGALGGSLAALGACLAVLGRPGGPGGSGSSFFFVVWPKKLESVAKSTCFNVFVILVFDQIFERLYLLC